MSLELISFCRYYTARGGRKRQEDWDAFWLVQAVKGDPVNACVSINISGQWRTLNQATSAQVRGWFGELVQQFNTQTSILPALFCPIPDRNCTEDRVPSKILPLVEAAISRVHGIGVWDGLRWHHPMPSSRKSNQRDVRTLHSALRVIKSVPARPEIVLIDDVSTTGAHLRAAASRIRENGGICDKAICLARTILDQTGPAFGIERYGYEDFNS